MSIPTVIFDLTIITSGMPGHKFSSMQNTAAESDTKQAESSSQVEQCKGDSSPKLIRHLDLATAKLPIRQSTV